MSHSLSSNTLASSTTVSTGSSAVPNVPIARIVKEAPGATQLEFHDNVDQRLANQAAHQANMMSSTSVAAPNASPVPSALLHDVEAAKGKVPHAHHVDMSKVEHSSVPLGHVQKDPTMMDKLKDKLHMSSGKEKDQTNMLPARADIPHSALPDDVLKQVHSQHGKPENAHHVDIDKIEKEKEKASATPLGHVQPEKNILQRATEFLTQAVPAQRPNVPTSALSSAGVLKEVTSAGGEVPNAHHVDLAQVEHSSVPLGRVVDKDNNNNHNNNKSDKSMMDKIKDKISGTDNSASHQDATKHAAVPETVLNDVRHGHANLHHVDINAVEAAHAPAGLGHVTGAPAASSSLSSTNARFNTHNAL